MFYEHGGSELPHQASWGWHSSGGCLLSPEGLDVSGSAVTLLGVCICSSSCLCAVTFYREQITLSPASVCYMNSQRHFRCSWGVSDGSSECREEGMGAPGALSCGVGCGGLLHYVEALPTGFQKWAMA